MVLYRPLKLHYRSTSTRASVKMKCKLHLTFTTKAFLCVTSEMLLMWGGSTTKLFIMLLHYWAVEYSMWWDEINQINTSSVFLNVLFQVLCSAEDWVNHGAVPHHIHRSVCVSNCNQRWIISKLIFIFSSHSWRHIAPLTHHNIPAVH